MRTPVRFFPTAACLFVLIGFGVDRAEAEEVGETLRQQDLVADVAARLLADVQRMQEGALVTLPRIVPVTMTVEKKKKKRGVIRQTLRHIDKERRNAQANVAEAVRTTAKAPERLTKVAGHTVADAGERLRKGDPVGAMMRLNTGVMRSQEKVALTSVQESSLLRTVGQVGAEVVVPGGAALFTTWYVGRTTGDAKAALKAGLVTGTTAMIGSGVASAPVSVGTKVAAGAAVGATSSAMLGGNVRDGALMGAFSAYARDFYEKYTTLTPDGAAGGDPISKGTKAACDGRPDCNVVVSADDMRKLVREKPGRTHIGKFNRDVSRTVWETNVLQEGGFISRGANLIPGMNAMSIFHDIWSLDWKLDRCEAVNVLTIVPSIPATYVAMGAGNSSLQVRQAMEQQARAE